MVFFFFSAFCAAQWNVRQSRPLFVSQSSLQIKDSQNIRGGLLLCFVKLFQVMENKANNKVGFELSHHFAVFHVKVKANADISTVAGRGSSSVHVRADGKDRVKLDAQVSHSLQRGDRAVGLRVNVSQSLLPSATDLHVNMAANMSADRYVCNKQR